MFVQGLQIDLTKEVMMRGHAPTTYFKALNRTISAKIMLDRMDREKDSHITVKRAN